MVNANASSGICENIVALPANLREEKDRMLLSVVTASDATLMDSRRLCRDNLAVVAVIILVINFFCGCDLCSL
jgi:hypothetical protein